MVFTALPLPCCSHPTSVTRPGPKTVVLRPTNRENSYGMVVNIEPFADRYLVRCRFCTRGADFSVMIAYKDGQFVCPGCSSGAPGGAPYRCSCPHCLKLTMDSVRLRSAARVLTWHVVKLPALTEVQEGSG